MFFYVIIYLLGVNMSVNFKDLDKLDLADYESKLDEMSRLDLVYEKARLAERMDMKYLKLYEYDVKEQVENISENAEEKERIFLRHRLKFIIKMINSELKKKFVQDYSSTWHEVNKNFDISSFKPFFAEKVLEKTVTFADRLSTEGMKAYKNYLLFLHDNLSNKNLDVEDCIGKAIIEEMKVDNGELNRGNFFSRNVIIESEKLTKTILKERLIDKKIKELDKKMESIM